MAYTFIPEAVMIIVYFVGFFFMLGYYAYTSLLMFLNVGDIKKNAILNNIVMFSTFFYATASLVAFIVHGVMSGYYHDSHGTGPSDIELNFNIIHLVFTLVLLLIVNTKLNQNKA